MPDRSDRRRTYITGVTGQDGAFLQQDGPDDYVLATGETTEVRPCVRWAFEDAGVAMTFRGEGIDEKAYTLDDGRVLVEVDPRHFGPTEVDLLIGDLTKAHQKPGWRHDTEVRELAREMVAADLQVTRDAPIASESR